MSPSQSTCRAHARASNVQSLHFPPSVGPALVPGRPPCCWPTVFEESQHHPHLVNGPPMELHLGSAVHFEYAATCSQSESVRQKQRSLTPVGQHCRAVASIGSASSSVVVSSVCSRRERLAMKQVHSCVAPSRAPMHRRPRRNFMSNCANTRRWVGSPNQPPPREQNAVPSKEGGADGSS